MRGPTSAGASRHPKHEEAEGMRRTLRNTGVTLLAAALVGCGDVSEGADLVIVSDGYIPNAEKAMPWYKYFLDSNPKNRGYLYTVGSPGHPAVNAAFLNAGFDIYVYKVL